MPVPERVPMNVDPAVRTRLNRLLCVDSRLMGIGYSAFIDAAIDAYDAGEWDPISPKPGQ